MEKIQAEIKYYKYGAIHEDSEEWFSGDRNFILDDDILNLCKNIDLEKMLDLFFAKYKDSSLDVVDIAEDDYNDFYRVSIYKNNNKFYVLSQDDYEENYISAYKLSITEYLKGLEFAGSFIRGVQLIKDYHWSEFDIPLNIATKIKNNLHQGDLYKLNCSINQCIADALDENIEFLIEWLRIKYDYPDKYEEFKNNFKDIIYKILNRYCIKVFPEGSKYMDGFAYVKLNEDLVLNGEYLFLDRIKELDKNNLKAKDLYDNVNSLLSTYSNKELTIKRNPLNDSFHDYIDHAREQVSKLDSSVRISSTIFTVAFKIDVANGSLDDGDLFSKMLFIDFKFDVPTCEGAFAKDISLNYYFNKYDIKIDDIFFAKNKDECKEAIENKIVLNMFNFLIR